MMVEDHQPPEPPEPARAPDRPRARWAWAEAHPGALGLLLCTGTVIVGAGIKFAAPVLVPVVLGGLVATVTLPLVTWLRARGARRSVAISLAILVDVLALAAVVSLVISSIGELSERLPEYVALLADAATRLAHTAQRWNPRLAPADIFDWTAITRLATSVLGGLAGFLWNIMLTLVIAAFVLLEATRPGIGGAPRYHPRASRMRGPIHDVNKYVAIKTAVSLATGLLVGGWVWVLGGDLPILFGLMAFVLNYIPNLGSILAAIPAVGLALLQHGPGTAAGMAAGYLTINVVIGNIVEPRIMGRALGLSPLVVVLSVVVWGWLLGPTGALLSALLTVLVKLMLFSTEDLRWVALLLGPPPTTSRASAAAADAARKARREGDDAGAEAPTPPVDTA
jgi:AI-2 transport protein TqsA